MLIQIKIQKEKVAKVSKNDKIQKSLKALMGACTYKCEVDYCLEYSSKILNKFIRVR